MAIQFARIEIVSRSKGGSACCKGAYNARAIIKDEKTNVTYNFANRGDNVYHEILLPEHVDKSFANTEILMNSIEHIERKQNSQLLKDIVIALPDDKELDLQDRINITHEIIEEMEWVKNGLAVQIDIHKPHDGEKNWHAHLLIPTRRFTVDGKRLGAKARDLNPEFKTGKDGNFIIPEEDIIHERGKRVINRYFEKLGLENRVDMISTVPHEHIGPVRMRSIVNQAVERNEERAVAHLENIKDEHGVLDRITSTQSIFTKRDIERAVKEVGNHEIRAELIERTLKSERLIHLYAVDDNKARGNDKDGNNNAINIGKSQSETIYQKTDYYTTKEVREEEQRTFRIATRINSLPNYGSDNDNHHRNTDSNIMSLKEQIDGLEKGSLSMVQQQALSHILLSPSGVRVFRGRAGTGKSHVLGLAQLLSIRAGQKVIGLAPTNKAASELKGKGFEEAHTIKGFLFKLYNDRISLQNNSLLFVDEAGMVGTSDYQELLKVAKSKNCNLILAGDERQLTSVDKGGMFEVFADRFGSFELSDIKRQSKQWGREMAMHFASGHVKSGIDILEANKGIKENVDLEESMMALIEDFTSSKFDLKERLVITVRNKEVDALNYSIRTVLKETGVLTGKEISITRTGPSNKDLEDRYAAGDRILFKATDKNLKIENGEFATLSKVTEDQFTATTDKGNEVAFNPNIMSEFRHGYASTVYKAQGASIKDVYVLHNRAGNNRNSYVAMTRHVEEIKLYSNKQSTSSRGTLINQLSRIDDKSASLVFYSSADIEEIRSKELNHLSAQNPENQTTFNKIANFVGDFAKETALSIADRFHHDPEYYEFDEKPKTMAVVQEVIEKTALDLETTEIAKMRGETKAKVDLVDLEDIEGIEESEQREHSEVTEAFAIQEMTAAKAGGSSRSSLLGISHFASNLSTNKGATSAAKAQPKEQFKNPYASSYRWSKQDSEDEMARLRAEVKYKAESIAYSILGTPNKHLSNRRTLRYGSKGSLVVTISGEKSGIWHDFSEDKGGDLLALVQREKNCDFKEAANYLKGMVGMQSHLRLVHDFEAEKFYAKNKAQEHQEQQSQASKIKRAGELYAKSTPIMSLEILEGKDHKDHNDTAKKYLSSTRGINSILHKSDNHNQMLEISHDIRTTAMWDSNSKKRYPALLAFARNNEGEITGGQTIYLSKNLVGAQEVQKADIPANKRSFGKISGSFVEIQKTQTTEQNITIIAEGLETALSFKEAGFTGKILCSLGVSNIRNYQPAKHENVIIAADNDGKDALSTKVIEEAVKVLSKQCFTITIKPKEPGDFNDVLQSQGIEGIKESLDPIIATINNLTADNKIADHKILKTIQTNLEQSQEQDKVSKQVQSTNIVDFFNVKEQIKQETSSPAIVNLLPKKVKIDNLQKLVQNYAYDRWQAQDQLPLSSNQINSLISRSLFEMKYKSEIQGTAEGVWHIDNGEEKIMDVATRVRCELDASRVTKMCGFAIEKLVLKDPENHLNFTKAIKDKIIIEELARHSHRDEMVEKAIEHNDIVIEAASKGKAFQISIAEQLVDYLWQGGSKEVSDEQIDVMNLCATLEQKLIPILNEQVTKDLQQGFKALKVGADQQGLDVASTVDLALHNIRSNIDNERYKGDNMQGHDQHHAPTSIEVQTLLNNADHTHSHDHDLHHLLDNVDHHEITRYAIINAIKAQEELHLERQEQKQQQGVLCGKVRIFSQGVSRALSMLVTEDELILN